MSLPRLDVPTYQVILPSTNNPVSFRPFLVKEHKVLLTMQEADNDEVVRIVKELVDVCTFNKLEINKLPHFDIEYLFMHLRAKSIGEIVDVIITCANCEEKYDSSFNIESIKVERKEGITNKVKISDTTILEFKYPNFDDVIGLFNSDDISTIIDMVASCLVGVVHGNEYYETKMEKKEDVEEFLMSMTKEQFSKVEEYFVNSPKIVQVVESDCPHCKHHNTSRIEGIRNFFV
jgi:hypothetical protein